MDELEVLKVYDYDSINMVWAKDKGLLNRGNEKLYMDYIGLAAYLGMEVKELSDYIGYDSNLRTAIAYYRGEAFQMIKVFDISFIPALVKALKYAAIKTESIEKQLQYMLKDIRRQEGLQ
jgi:hypothetical protein